MIGLLSARPSRFSASKLLLAIVFSAVSFVFSSSVFAQTASPSTLTASSSAMTLTASSSVPSVATPSIAFDPEMYGLAAAYAMTPKTQHELYAWQADVSWPIASLTKLVSALVWKNYTVPWTKVVNLQKVDEVGGGRLRVPVGTALRFEALWYSSITASANNASMALARLLGVSKKQLNVLMNREITRAGATQAQVFEPSGMDVRNVASAREMALIADRAFSWRPLQKAASTEKYVVNILGKKPSEHPIYTTNDLLRYDPDIWVIAGKTGYLEESRNNFVGWLRPVGVDGKPEAGKDVLVVIYGAPTRAQMFAAAKALAQSLWSSHATFASPTDAHGTR